jgi:MoaA/NifB/PqqE/SkfB family radical SAM enzyme
MRPDFRKYLKTFRYVSRNVIGGSGVFPFYASFKITSRCESSCAHCYVPREKPVPDLGTEDAKAVIRNLASSSTLVLTLEGGEPFLRDDIGELLAFARTFPVYVSVVTSYPRIARERCSHLSPLIDFLQVSIDENHGNMTLFDGLDGIKSAWSTRICIQTVVSAGTLGGMDEKARISHDSGCKILFIPLSPIYPELDDDRPDGAVFVDKVRMLKRRYPGTVVRSSNFLDSYGKGWGCTSSSVIVDSDGRLFYPCHVLGEKPFSLLAGGIEDFLLSDEAKALRAMMKECTRSCGWYQYFAVSLKSGRDLPGDIRSALERVR